MLDGANILDDLLYGIAPTHDALFIPDESAVLVLTHPLEIYNQINDLDIVIGIQAHRVFSRDHV